MPRRTKFSTRKARRRNVTGRTFATQAVQSPLQMAREVERGLPIAAFDELVRSTGLDRAEAADVARIPIRTLSRRQHQGRLDPDESDRVLRLSRIVELAMQLFDGDGEATEAWLRAPRAALGGQRPLWCARTDVGAQQVERLIGRLEHGVPG